MPRRDVIAGADHWSYEGHGTRAITGVVVIHGFTGTALAVRPLAEALARRGFRVEVPRLPGHATHWRDLVPMRYHDWRAEVQRVVERQAECCRTVVLVGQSMGGTLALDLGSVGNAKVAGVVAINAQVLDREGLMGRLAPLLSRVAYAVPSRVAGLPPDDVSRPGMSERGYRWVPARAAQSLLDALPRVRAQLSATRTPLLVAYSLRDGCVSPQNSTAIPNLTGAPTEMLALERSRHLATLDYDSELLQARIESFVDQVGGHTNGGGDQHDE